jgi:hypothetical protein
MATEREQLVEQAAFYVFGVPCSAEEDASTGRFAIRANGDPEDIAYVASAVVKDGEGETVRANLTITDLGTVRVFAKALNACWRIEDAAEAPREGSPAAWAQVQRLLRNEPFSGGTPDDPLVRVTIEDWARQCLRRAEDPKFDAKSDALRAREMLNLLRPRRD